MAPDQPGLVELLGHWLDEPAKCQFRPAPGGLTRSIVLRVAAAGGRQWALKGSPVGTDPGRLAAVSVRLAAAGCGLLTVPLAAGGGDGTSAKIGPNRLAGALAWTDPEPIFVVAGGDRVWQLFDWRPGQPAPRDAGDDVLLAGGGAIAEIHRAFNGTSTEMGSEFDGLACLVDRREAIERLQTAAADHLRPPPLSLLSERIAKQLADPSDPAAAYLAFSLHDAHDVLAGTLRPAIAAFDEEIADLRRENARPAVGWTLRDGHRENVLFAQGKVSAVIDCDSLRVDALAMDLARWAVDFTTGQSPGQRLAAAVAGYDERATSRGGGRLSQTDQRLAAAILNISRPLTLVHWLTWLVRDRGRIGVTAGSLADRIATVTAGVRAGPVTIDRRR